MSLAKQRVKSNADIISFYENEPTKRMIEVGKYTRYIFDQNPQGLYYVIEWGINNINKLKSGMTKLQFAKDFQKTNVPGLIKLVTDPLYKQ